VDPYNRPFVATKSSRDKVGGQGFSGSRLTENEAAVLFANNSVQHKINLLAKSLANKYVCVFISPTYARTAKKFFREDQK
jgi:hypothetical protein